MGFEIVVHLQLVVPCPVGMREGGGRGAMSVDDWHSVAPPPLQKGGKMSLGAL